MHNLRTFFLLNRTQTSDWAKPSMPVVVVMAIAIAIAIALRVRFHYNKNRSTHRTRTHASPLKAAAAIAKDECGRNAMRCT